MMCEVTSPYKDGWRFQLVDKDRGQGSRGLTFVVTITTPDSYGERGLIGVTHYFIVPAAAYNERSWRRWLLEQILLVERHEACEFFEIDRTKPFAPHHADGNDPYTVFEVGDYEETRVPGGRAYSPSEVKT